jgi:integrase/recombinase XerD
MSTATASIFLDTRRALKDGSFPVKLTIYYLGKKRHYKTPFRLTEDAYKKVQGSNLKDQELKNTKNSIYKWLGEQEAILKGLEQFDFDAFGAEFTKGEQETKTRFSLEQVQPFFDDYINRLRVQGRIKTAESYQSALNSLLQFRRYLKFQDITPDFLSSYEVWMLSRKKSKTSVGVYLRSLRTIYNLAMQKGVVNHLQYPFKRYTIPAPRKAKRAFKDEHIKALFKANMDSESYAKALDIWRFSFICNGINLKDIAFLKWENVSGDYMEFFRKKTENTKRENILPIRVHLNKHAHAIIKKWGNPPAVPETYLFPILEQGLSLREIENRIANFTRVINKYLKRIGEELGIPVKLTTYTARHSFATKLKNSEKVSLSFIMESLGHSSIKTTMDYLAGFEDDSIRKNHEVLMEGLE